MIDARRMWTLFEPVHALTYFTPEAQDAYLTAGLRGYWRGYFAGRAAPLGAVEAAPVIAIFYGFAPAMVARALPSVWSLATPAETLAARSAGAEAAMARAFAGLTGIDEAADLATRAVGLLEYAGRPLGAANAAISVEDASPAARLWQATATLREHRGDAHVAALLTYGFDGCESAVWRTRPGRDEDMQGFRGWTPDEWSAAIARLTERGWLAPADGRGEPTESGRAAYAAVEAATDRAAAQVWEALGEDATDRLA
ncbi:MAG TPA: hypothetical protein VGJ28_23010, partial [Micromonosporaceae bacterium]